MSQVRSLVALLGCQYPIVQAPMAGVQDARLALAVCAAGGLGSLPAAMLAPQALAEQLKTMVDGGAKAYNVNFFCHSPPQADPPRHQRWLRTLAPFYAELGLNQDLGLDPAIGSRQPFGLAQLEVLEAFKPPVVSFHFGLPDTGLLNRVRAWGAVIMCSATTLEEAVFLEQQGVDVVIAQGLEAGGHRGSFLNPDPIAALATQPGLMALLPQVANALRIPVLAAGAMADSRTVAAAMALGASGVQAGTCFLLCPEANTSPLHRAALQSPAATSTALTNLFSGRPARGIVNSLMAKLGPLHPAAPAFPLATAALAPLRAQAEAQGSTDFTPLWAGQNALSCRVAPAAHIIQELVDGLVLK